VLRTFLQHQDILRAGGRKRAKNLQESEALEAMRKKASNVSMAINAPLPTQNSYLLESQEFTACVAIPVTKPTTKDLTTCNLYMD
jgi:hypothetical protein